MNEDLMKKFNDRTSTQNTQEYDSGKLRSIDKKLIDKPAKYDGQVQNYVEWAERFKTFLSMQDIRWKELLMKIEDRKDKVLTAAGVTMISEDLNYPDPENTEPIE